MVPLTNAQMRAFKAQAQRLKATLKIGKNGISLQFLAALDDALGQHELVKVKFDDFKDQKKELLLQRFNREVPGSGESAADYRNEITQLLFNLDGRRHRLRNLGPQQVAVALAQPMHGRFQAPSVKPSCSAIAA